MRVRLSQEASEVLAEGTFCWLAATWKERPHVTPVAFAPSGPTLWLTTSRSSVKARAWKRDPSTAGLIREGTRALAFRGTARTYDALDATTWPRALLHGPALTRAALRFTVRNALFFAGYARDARRVPFAWTPPGRVFAEARIEAWALLDASDGTVIDREGYERTGVRSASSYRALRGRTVPWPPREVARAVGHVGEGSLGILTPATVVLPARWRRDATQGAYLLAVPTEALELAGARTGQPMSLTADRASRWRAADMRGWLAQGAGTIHVPSRTRSGRASVEAALAKLGAGPGYALVRLRLERVTWWSGWEVGTVEP